MSMSGDNGGSSSGGQGESPAANQGASTGNGPTPGEGKLTIVEGGSYSASEQNAARYMSEQGHDVTLRPPSGTRAGGGTSDLLVDGKPYDVYTPTTSNPDRIISAIAKKNTQAEGVVLDLTGSSVTRAQLGNVVARVQGAGATKITNVVIIGGQ
jgi:filamentous hemagglutinin